MFDLSAYLDRVGLADCPRSASGLALLQAAQMRAIPFEAIDPLLGFTPDLSLDSIAAKLVHGGRGGYCYELNLLLEAALLALGFAPRRALARVRMGKPSGGPRTHLALEVAIDGIVWLVDAGFGGPAPLVPLRRDADAPQHAPNGTYVLRDDAATGDRVVWLDGDEPFALYSLDGAAVTDGDIAAANHVSATWAGAPFPNHLMVGGFDGAIRIGLFDTALTEHTHAETRRRTLRDAEDLRAVLCDRLRLQLPPDRINAIWRRIAPA